MDSGEPGTGAATPTARLRRSAGRLRGAARRTAEGRVTAARHVTALPGGRRPARDDVYVLSFDDGPHPEVTPALLEVLAAERAPAVFFMCGENARRHPDVVRAVAAAGHEVAGHTWDHQPLRGRTRTQLEQQIEHTHELLADLSGRRVRYFRPPYGILDVRSRRHLRRVGVTVLGGSALGLDWIERDPVAISDRVVERLAPGGVVLLHDACGDLLVPDGELAVGTHADRRPTVAALPRIMAGARAVGLRPVPLPEPRSRRG